jgi:peptide-methionine (R)-S-oxide reductase
LTRRQILASLVGIAGAAAAVRWILSASAAAPVDVAGSNASGPNASGGGPTIDRLELPDAEWQTLLAAPAYAVLRKEATEMAGSSPLNTEKRPGTFICAGCFLPLFRSEQKYESGTGWPSFFDFTPGSLGTQRDYSLGVLRTEYHCIRCGGHQGHVFNDGPQPTGLRYCNNGVALRFVAEDGETLPPLRQRS